MKKKLLFLLMTIVSLVGFAPNASAWTFYVDTSNTGWSTVHMHCGNGTGWRENKTGTKIGNNLFKFEFGDWSDLSKIAFTQSGTDLAPSSPYYGDFTKNNNSADWKMESGACYKLNSSGNGATVTFNYTPPSNIVYYLVGNDFGNWDSTSYPLTDNGDGTWSIDVANLSKGWFKVRAHDGSNFGNNWGSGNTSMSVDHSYTMYKSGDNCGMSSEQTNVKIIFTAPSTQDDNGSIMVVKNEVVNNETVYYLRGTFTNNWAAQDAYKFTYSDGVYTLNNVTIPANSQWKISDASWSSGVSVGAASGYTVKVNGQTGVVTDKGGNDHNFTCAKELKNAKVVFNPIAKTIDITYNSIPAYVNMPLNAGDFANNKKHYFIVGSRMGDWRLQPEWELTVNDNTATLSGRLMYNGLMGIAMVDNYEDYVNHRYKLYATNAATYYVRPADDGLSGTVSGLIPVDDNMHALQYGNNGQGWPDAKPDKALYWTVAWGEVGNAAGNFKYENIRDSHPRYLQSFTLSLDSSTGAPTSFSYVCKKDADVSPYKTFSLVGNGIKNDLKAWDGTDLYTKGPAYNRNQVANWANAWIQYNPTTGQPYVDALGNTMYLTAYDKAWMEGHKSRFTMDLGDGTVTEKSSSDMTFIDYTGKVDPNDEYSDLYTAHPYGTAYQFSTGGQRVQKGNLDYNETLQLYGAAGSGNYSSSTWRCYVVKDMWMQSSFKVWTGFGGSLKAYISPDLANENSNYDNYQWNLENGGHGTIDTPKTVNGSDFGSNATVYGMRQDVKGADFQINGSDTDLRYYKRVILWYDEVNGLDNSVLQLVTESAGPNILARRNADNNGRLDYRWRIDTESSDSRKVESITIVRRQLDENGNVIATVNIPVSGVLGKTAGQLSTWQAWTPDETGLNALDQLATGDYDYIISVQYQGNNTVRTGKSNDIWIYAAETPLIISAQQEINDGIYSFNVKINTKVDNSMMNRTTDEGKLASELAKHITLIAANDATAEYLGRTTGITYKYKGTENTFEGVPATSDQTVNDGVDILWGTTTSNNQIYVGGTINEWLPAGTRYIRFNLKADAGLDVPEIIVKNIMPNNVEESGASYETKNPEDFAFYAYLTPDEEIAARQEWATLQFRPAAASCKIIAPEVTITPDPAVATPVVIDLEDEEVLEYMQPSSTYVKEDQSLDHELMKWLPRGATIKDENGNDKLGNAPIFYQRYNELSSDIKIELPISDDVLGGINELTAENAAHNPNYDAEGMAPYFKLVFWEEDHVKDGVKVNAFDMTYEDAANNPAYYVTGHFTGRTVEGTLNRVPFPAKKLQENENGTQYYAVNSLEAWDLYPYVEVHYCEYRNNDGTWETVESSTTPRKLVKPLKIQVNNLNQPELTNAHVDYQILNIPDINDPSNITKMLRLQVVGNLPKSARSNFHSYFSFDFDNAPAGLWDNRFNYEAAHGGMPLNWGDNKLPFDSLPNYNAEGTQLLTDVERIAMWTPKHDWSSVMDEQAKFAIDLFPMASWPSDHEVTTADIQEVVDHLGGRITVIYPFISDDMSFVEKSAQSSARRRIGPANPATDDKSYSNAEGKFDHSRLVTVGVPTDLSASLPLGSALTGVELPTSDMDANATYYNLQGIRVVNPISGQIYLVRRGAKVSKEIVK